MAVGADRRGHRRYDGRQRERVCGAAEGEVGVTVQPYSRAEPLSASRTVGLAQPRDAIRLPATPLPLIGREQQLMHARDLLLRPQVRVLTLTGPAGTGKTRLGLAVAAELVEAFADGVCFVDLGPIGEPRFVLSTIASALALRDGGGEPLGVTLRDALRDRVLLLVLDNFEQVLAAAPDVSKLLASGPGLKALVTSRERLHLYGEQELVVPPLELPSPQRLPSMDALIGVPAVALFLQRAQSVAPDFQLTEANKQAVAEVCVRLDGLPLALELAAARSKLLSPEALLARLEHRLELLTHGPRDVPARQQTLRAAMDWSHDLLRSDERLLFRRLAVFVGGWTLDAAEAVAGDGAPVLETLASLVDQSLVRRLDDTTGEPRFRLLETIREYAQDQLRLSGQLDLMRHRHAAFFMDLVRTAEPELMRLGQAAWLERLEQEHDNLRAALDWATSGGDAEYGLALAGGLRLFWEVHGHLSEGRRWLEKALAGAADAPLGTRIKGLHAAGYLAARQGDFLAARSFFEEGLAIQRRLGDQPGIATFLTSLALVAEEEGDLTAAGARCEESLVIFRRLGDQWSIARTLNNLGLVHYMRGDHPQARRLYEESLALFRGLGDKRSIAVLLGNLGLTLCQQREFAAARINHVEGLRLRRELEDTLGTAEALTGLGALAAVEGRVERATRLFAAAQIQRESIGAAIGPAYRAECVRHVPALRMRLGETAFSAAWAEGSAMPLEEAIACALGPAEVAPAEAGANEEPAGTTSPGGLSTREREVATLVAQGLGNREIAEQLVITERTAGNHVEHILNKLGFHTRAQIAAWAVQHGLIPRA
jgi:predicted ATPase/DNA-binding CsgD family transcriptional regulator